MDYNDVLLKLNIFRSKANNNDFMYLKKRLVLSKIVDINDQDNIVELNDEKLQPYSTFKFDDESIYKLISIIDDLNMWVELTRNNTISDIDLITQQLAKWAYCLNDGQFTNIEKIVNGIKNLNRGTKLYVMYSCVVKEGHLRTNSVNDFVIKSMKKTNPYLTKEEFRSGIFIGYWTRQVTEDSIVLNDDINLKK